MAQKFQSIPVIREAIQMPDAKLWADYVNGHTVPLGGILAISEFVGETMIGETFADGLQIKTPSGIALARPTDWIVRESATDFYPVSDDVFSAKYREVRIEATTDVDHNGNHIERPVPVADSNPKRTEMSFSLALETLRIGKRVARVGWNGKNMWLIMIHSPDADSDTVDYIIRDDTIDAPTDGLKCLPWIGMRTANSEFVPWLASQTDLLAND